jgi:two-component system phosphate regulon sensor histidine kinase PhoR
LSNLWPAEFWRLFAVLLLALIVGAIAGHVGFALAIALTGYLIWHLINPPDASGIWGEIFNYIYRLQKHNRQRKRRLAAMLNRFQEATSAMPDATVVLGPYGDIQWFNDAAQHLLGLRPSQDGGQRIDNLIRQPEFISYLTRGKYEQSVQLRSPAIEDTTLSVRIVPYGNEQRLLLARDVSHLQRIEQMRRDFVGNVSHELRTPLTVISGFLETLADDKEDPCTQQWGRSLHLMQQQTTRMQHIVEDLLLLSRLETDRSGAPREPVAVPALLEMIREDAVLLSGDKGHEIHLEVDPTLGIYGAERELHSAFANLVTNAVRYTPERGVITIRWYQDSAGAHFEVADTGSGIAPEHLPRLTERFYRVDVGRSRQSGGTGLGLAIVKHVLTRHDARLRIESEVGKGSLFVCDFAPARIVSR